VAEVPSRPFDSIPLPVELEIELGRLGGDAHDHPCAHAQLVVDVVQVERGRVHQRAAGDAEFGEPGVPRDKRTLLKGAFVATMKSSHVGIFRREGKARPPIEELRGSRPVDALLHQGEAQGVADRGGQSFAATFKRVLPIEVGK
jgi:hypothetical protein